MATHSSTLAWKIPWTEEATVPGIINGRTQLSNFTFHCNLLSGPLTSSITTSPGNVFKVRVDEWRSSTLYNAILFRYLKNLTICDSMDGPQGHYTKQNKWDKDKCQIVSLLCGILKKKKLKPLLSTENILVVLRDRGWGLGWMDERGQKVQTSSYNEQVMGL